jgi:hypothetical protein
MSSRLGLVIDSTLFFIWCGGRHGPEVGTKTPILADVDDSATP